MVLGCRATVAEEEARFSPVLLQWRWHALTLRFATFFGVHTGLAMGSIYITGSEEQKQKWLPPMARMEKIGCFGLTEPLVGSGASGGLMTTAKKEGDTWVLNGQKKWIGNSPWCDISIIWARDVADNQVKGFIVENKTTPGFSVEKIQNKFALKVVQNGLITLKDVRLPEENHLQAGIVVSRYGAGAAPDTLWRRMGGDGMPDGRFRTCAQVRPGALAVWKADWLVSTHPGSSPKMLANVTACQCLVARTGQLDDQGKLTDAQAALSKAFTTAKCRETVAWGREIFGGNGISIDYNVGRFFTDAEALLSYEGTSQMQNLISAKPSQG